VDIPIPRFVPAAPEASATAPRTPTERRFEQSEEWKGAIIKGRILREQPPNGFVVGADAGEIPFFPAKLGPNGPEPNPSMKDDMTGLIGLLGLCRKTPVNLFECVAVGKDGTETVIPQTPMPQGELL
jgi:hypothetical protein